MRNLIVLSDGTGNSAAAAAKTNVWRLYQALDLTDGTQIAEFGDGVGTSSFKPLRILGLALGIGVKRNVINLYKFLCRSYGDHDRIWCFGFSRGAFTVRTLMGLINHEGLISFRSEEELDRSAVAAYRAYRKKSFHTRLPWVRVGRALRDTFLHYWCRAIGARTYEDIKKETFDRKRHVIDIQFVGVWDTVAAYGLPVDELTQAVDKWVWPMSFRDTSLLANVKCARHALSIDDERRTFFPIPWDETQERKLRADDPNLPRDRLLQVWFAGVHANVGGGYPDDSLAYVPLCWMIAEAQAKGLRFRSEIVAAQVGLASATGRAYDSRRGFGSFYRYQPRDARVLMGDGNRPLIHHSVVTRMALGGDGYAPISLPYDIDVLPQYGASIPFNAAAAAELIAAPNGPPAGMPTLAGVTLPALQQEKIRTLENIIQLDTAAASTDRAPLVDLVLDTVWWRRLLYFVSLALTLIIVAYPLIGASIEEGANLPIDAENPVRWAVDETVGLVRGFLPGYAEPWVNALVESPAPAVFILLLLAASLALSAFLQRRIRDRSRAAWRVQARVDGKTLDQLRLTGQRHAAACGTVAFLVLLLIAYALDAKAWLQIAFAAPLAAFFLLFLRRKFRDAGTIDAAHPGFLLALSRRLRTWKPALAAYRYTARTLAPALFLFACAIVVLSVVHHASFSLWSATGHVCERPNKSEERTRVVERIGKAAPFHTSELCQGTGLHLLKGHQYRVTLTIEDAWFDKAVWTDVRGFPADRFVFYAMLPFKRWWTKNWFLPIARVDDIGNFEYPLEPASPLPESPLPECEPPENPLPIIDRIKTIPVPAPKETRDFVMKCGRKKIAPPQRVLIADITPRTSGELFLYVNDAAPLIWPGSTKWFYDNNSGTASVEVTRILADDIVPDGLARKGPRENR